MFLSNKINDIALVITNIIMVISNLVLCMWVESDKSTHTSHTNTIGSDFLTIIKLLLKDTMSYSITSPITSSDPYNST